VTTVSGLSKPQTCDRYASVRRLANTLLRTWLSTGFIIAVIMWQHSGLYLPNGDPAHDRTVKPRADMMIFYGAAKVMRHSPADLYDQRKEAAAQKAATGLEISSEDRDFLPYAYPAIVALLFVPFTVLSYKTAYFLMLIINFLLLGITLWILSDRLKLCGHNEKIFVLSATAFLPVYAVFLNGQLSFLLLLFSSLTITNLRAGRMVRAGIWCGLTAVKPTFLPIFLLWLAARRYWKTFACASVVAGTMALFSIVLVGFHGSADYITLTTRLAQGYIYTAPLSWMYNLNALVHFLNAGRLAWLATTATVLASLLLRKRRDASGDWDYCALITASVLAAPYLLIQELDVMLIVLALVLAQFREPISLASQWTLFGIMTAPTILYAAKEKGGHDWPIVPITLLITFVIFTFLSFRKTNNAYHQYDVIM